MLGIVQLDVARREQNLGRRNLGTVDWPATALRGGATNVHRRSDVHLGLLLAPRCESASNRHFGYLREEVYDDVD